MILDEVLEARKANRYFFKYLF